MLETTVVKIGRIYKNIRNSQYVIPFEFIVLVDTQFVKYNIIETGNYAVMKLGEFVTRWRLAESEFLE